MSGGRAVVALALRRLRRRPGSALLAAAGVAAAAAFLATILAGAGVARDRSVGRAVEEMPAAARAVRAVWFGVPSGTGETWPRLDADARAALAPLGLGPPTALVLVRESTVAGRFVGIAGVDGLAGRVTLRSGRLPRACAPARCEVLRLRGAGALPRAPGLRLVQVGTASLRTGVLFGDFLQPTDAALADAVVAPALARSGRYHRPAAAPLVVAEGVATLARSPALDRAYRSYAWVLPLAAGRPRAWDVDATLAQADRARAALQARSSSWALTGPAQELGAARDAAAVASRRLVLVGGQAAVLLVAFALLAAGAMRDDLDAARTRLTWNGARRWQLRLLAATESLAVGVCGAAAGWTVGVLLGGLLAGQAGAPVAPLLRETVLSPAGLGLAALVALGAGCVVWLAVASPPREDWQAWPDLAAVLALVVVAALLLGGSLDPDRLRRDDGSAVVLLLVPGLVALAAAVVAARALRLLGRAIARAGRARPGAALAGAGLARGPGLFAVAFVALAVGLAVLAEGYRATLDRGERDQAAFRVPADVLVQEDLSRLVGVFDVATPARLSALVGDGSAHPVTRIAASAGASERVGGVTLLGLPPGALAEIPLWREAWGPSPGALARAVRPRVDPTPRGVRLRGRALRIELGPTLLSARAVVVGPDGRVASLALGAGQATRRTTLTAPLPAPLRGGGTLVAVELDPPRLIERGADAGTALRGAVRLSVTGADLSGWVGEGGITASRSGQGLLLRYVVTPQRRARVRARQVSDEELPAVAATPALVELAGGPGGVLPLRVAGERVNVRVVAEVTRFPGAGRDAVVGDRDALRGAIDAVAPGAGGPTELWLTAARGDGPRLVRALGRPPFASLRSTSRAALVAEAQRDPLGRGTLLALLAGTLVALALAVAGLALVVLAQVGDERGELLDLEAQGASPALLVRVVRARALLVAVVGVGVGLVTGAVLVVLVSRIVTVTSRAVIAEPPLVATIDPAPLVALLGAFVVTATLVVLLLTRDARRPRRARRDA